MAKARNVEVMEVGVANGIPFSLEDLREVVRAFNEQGLADRLPVKLGHSDDDSQPAQGWISDMRVSGNKVLADIDDVPDDLVEEIKQGRWRFVSMELLKNAKRGGKEYKWMPDGLALLGAVRPAFDALKGLAEVFASGIKGVSFESRFSFARENASEADRLKAENIRLQQELIRVEFNGAIEAGKILPREREAFSRRFGQAGTADDARAWIASSQKPAGSTQQTLRGEHTTFERADEELVERTKERQALHFAQTGQTLDYAAASLLVVREQRELARRYITLPGDL